MSGSPKESSRKRRCTHFAVGDFVHGRTTGDREGVVVRRHGGNTVVVGSANIVGTWAPAQLRQSTWRDTVEEGDVVEFLSANVWHPAIVRGVQASPGRVAHAAHAYSGKV